MPIHPTRSLPVAASALALLITSCNGAWGDFAAWLAPPADSLADQEIAWARLPIPRSPREEPERGTRPMGLCPIAPMSLEATQAQIWSDRPLLIWAEPDLGGGVQGSVKAVELHQPDSPVPLWSQSTEHLGPSADAPPATAWQLEQVAYTAEPLTPGQSYTWVLFDGQNRPLESGEFQLMAADQRQAIAAELATLEADLTTDGANPEAVAFAKASYFAEQNLWSDALQVVFAVENPSPSLVEFQNQVLTQTCETP